MLRSAYLFTWWLALIVWAAAPALAQAPAITAVSPANASYGETVTITGSNFADLSNLHVRFGAVAAPVTFASPTSIKVTVPAGASHAAVAVTNFTTGLTTSSGARFIPAFKGEVLDPARFIAQPPLAGKTGLKQLAVSDLNNDGKNDIAFSATGTNSLGIYQNNSNAGAYSFNLLNINLGVPSRGLTAADLNGDGRPELISTGFDVSGNLVFILRNTSSTSTVSFSSPSLLNTPTNGATRLEVLDLNKDGKPEIVVSDETTAKLYIFVNQSSSSGLSFSTSPIQISLPGANAYALQLQDLNGDDKPEIITANYLIGSVYYLLNESSSSVSFAAPQAILQGITSVLELKLGDLNGDGKADIALADNFANQLVISLNQSDASAIQFSPIHKISLQNSGAWDLDIADLDGDKLPDIAISHQNKALLSLFRNQGFTTVPAFQQFTVATTGNSTALKLADLNGDTRPDIVYTDIQNNTLNILSNTICPKPTLKQQCLGSGTSLLAPKFPYATYSWYKDNVLISTSSSESISISETGSYTVLVKLLGCSSTSPALNIAAVNGFPGNPVFEEIDPICEGESLVLTVSSPVSGSVYTWQNSNGFSATTTTPSYTIPEATASHGGSYWVKIQAGECEITLTSPGPASVSTPPTPSITPSKTGQICSGETITLSVASAYVSYQWKKDGQPLAGKTTNVLSINEPGSYTVTVGTTGNCTGQSTAYKFQPLTSPAALFTAPDVACLNQAMSFTNTSTAASGQDVHYLWSFGDGTTSTEKNPQHTYSSAAGSPYTVSLKIGYGSSFACASVLSKTVTVVEAEAVSIEASALEFCAGEETTVRIIGDVLAVQWSNGKQGTSITTTAGGTLEASITTAAGCTLTKSIELVRLPLPPIKIEADRMLINPGESARLTASGGTNYQWSPAESLDDPNSPTPLASPKTTTTYTLSSVSPEGCVATAQITIEVSNVFSVNIPKIFVPQADGLWVIHNLEEYPDFSLEVVNSLGQAVLQASPYLNNWDGTRQGGSPLPAGVYYYVFKDQSKKVVRTGSVTLLR